LILWSKDKNATSFRDHDCGRKLVMEKHSSQLENNLDGNEYISIKSWQAKCYSTKVSSDLDKITRINVHHDSSIFLWGL